MTFVPAVAAVALWAVLLLVLAVRTRNPEIQPVPPTAAFAGEPPAVVDLITGGWRLCEEASAATLLDLAARGAVQIEEVGPELSLVRLRRADALNPYEQLVYDHVRALATDGVVATGALAEGSRHLGTWWKTFRKTVVADARARGLSRPRWSRSHLTLLTAAATVPAFFLALGVTLSDTDHDLGAGIGLAVMAFFLLMTWVGKLNGERGTALGARAAGHWLGVRAHLATARFGDQPAAGVTVWGRPLAYAAALGLAPRAVKSLPVSVPADDRRAWSSYGGMWHAVEVRYPSRLVWGRKPLHTVGRALAAGFFAGFWSWIVLVVLSAFDLWPHSLTTLGGLAVGVAVALVPLARGLNSPAHLEGQVVRLRRQRVGGNENHTNYAHWCAIDEGTSRQLRAYGIDEELWNRLSEGDVVRARVIRGLGWIGEIQPIDQFPQVARSLS
ncbi:DUF2207 family protein [Nonomuraea sp. NPDC050556]|uniref:DUF2207 family protein n=1 Tax=Nonomuraea sp. NPDC050556 TaxID=3364369 RepID=UPI0037AB4DF4